MATIGSLGDVVFSVSNNTIRTFDEMKSESSAKFATHDRHLQSDLLEFEGMELDTISFSMVFSVFLGVNPYNELEKINSIMKQGKAMRLVIGGKVYGSNKWVIEKLSKEFTRFDNKGNLWAAKVSVSLKEYAKR